MTSVSVQLPVFVTVAPMKSVADLDPTLASFEVSPGAIPAENALRVFRQGLKYFGDAALSNAKQRKARNGDESELSIDEAREALDGFLSALASDSWSFGRTAAEPMSDHEKAMRELLTPKLYTLGHAVRANKKTGLEGVTPSDFIDAHESVDAAALAVARDFIAKNAPDYTPERVEEQAQKSLALLQEKAKALVKTWVAERKLKAKTSAPVDGEHVLDF